MTSEPRQPSIDELRGALAGRRPDLAAAAITYVAGGWDFWVYDAGGYILRVPRSPTIVDGDASWPAAGRLHLDRRLLQALQPGSTLPLPVPEVYDNALPDGRPLTLHRRLPGVPLIDLKRPLAPGAGVALARFLRRIHDFPVERAVALGLAYADGAAARKVLIATYETFVRRAFPLLGCESRTHAQRVFEAYINDPAVFSFERRLVHADIDARNVLADPQTGELSGVIDFTDARIGDRVWDAMWAWAGGFEQYGIADELPAYLNILGLTPDEVERHRAFFETWWPLNDIDHGVETSDRDLVEDAIYRLYAVTPRGIVCDA